MASISKKVLNSVMVALMSVSCGIGSVSAMNESGLMPGQTTDSDFGTGFKAGMAELGLANLSATEAAILQNKEENKGAGYVAAGAVIDLAKLGVLAGGLAATIKAIQYKSQLNKLKKNQPVSKTTPEKNKNTEIKINVSPAKPVVAPTPVNNQIKK